MFVNIYFLFQTFFEIHNFTFVLFFSNKEILQTQTHGEHFQNFDLLCHKVRKLFQYPPLSIWLHPVKRNVTIGRDNKKEKKWKQMNKYEWKMHSMKIIYYKNFFSCFVTQEENNVTNYKYEK